MRHLKLYENFFKNIFRNSEEPPIDIVQVLNDDYGFNIDHIDSTKSKTYDIPLISAKLKVFLTENTFKFNQQFIKDFKNIQRKLDEYGYTIYINMCSYHIPNKGKMEVQWDGLTIDEFINEIIDELPLGCDDLTTLGIYFKK